MSESVPTTTDEVQDLWAHYIKLEHDAEEAHKEARATLAECATQPGVSVDHLADLVNRVAKAYGKYEAAARARVVVAYLADPDRGNAQTSEEVTRGVLEEMYGVLTMGADDEWSGRKNDVRRAQHEGFREFANKIRWL